MGDIFDIFPKHTNDILTFHNKRIKEFSDYLSTSFSYPQFLSISPFFAFFFSFYFVTRQRDHRKHDATQSCRRVDSRLPTSGAPSLNVVRVTVIEHDLQRQKVRRGGKGNRSCEEEKEEEEKKEENEESPGAPRRATGGRGAKRPDAVQSGTPCLSTHADYLASCHAILLCAHAHVSRTT